MEGVLTGTSAQTYLDHLREHPYVLLFECPQVGLPSPLEKLLFSIKKKFKELTYIWRLREEKKKNNWHKENT